MPLPIIAGLGAKALAALKSKYLIHALLTGGFLAQTGLGEYGKSGERKLAKAQLEMQADITGKSAEAGKLATKESRKRSKEYTELLLKEKREDRREARKIASMQAFTQSQNQQMALLMQAIQAIATEPGGSNVDTPTGGGMLGVMRGNY